MSNENSNYDGINRRITQRREIPDRRSLVRFELDKEPRRKNSGRRLGEMLGGLWDKS